MYKAIVFDMDGTLADLYGVEGWLEDLQAENAFPYIVAPPLVDMFALRQVCQILKSYGYEIIITSWLAKDSSAAYDKEVRAAKKQWLDEYCFPYDKLHFIKYGRTKADCTRKKGGYQVLIDDNEKVRNGWTLGEAIDATTGIIGDLYRIIAHEQNGEV